MKLGTRVVLLAGLTVVSAGPALAQGTQAADAPPAILRIGREEVKPGKEAAHEVIETNWNAAYAKAKLPIGILGMTSMSGPGEAWWLQGFGSWEEMETLNKTAGANETWSAENQKFSAQDGELLNRSSGIILSYRPAMSYRAGSNLATKRYMQVQLVRVRPGRGREFADNWREIVAAHEKAWMDADPFWAPKPPPPAKPADKKK